MRDITKEDLLAKGIEAFGNQETFETWQNKISIPLGHVTPISLIGTNSGRKMVFDLLNQIIYSIYS